VERNDLAQTVGQWRAPVHAAVTDPHKKTVAVRTTGIVWMNVSVVWTLNHVVYIVTGVL